MRRPRVEILYFEDCPNHEPARALVERVAAELRVEPEIQTVAVPDPAAATKLRFLGSPTVRVDGRDVEPDADERRDFVFSCRVYRSEQGLSGQPQERWIREALAEASERELYFWILRRFATSGRPSGAETREAAEQLGLDAGRALETFARKDIVHLDREGEIAVAYPGERWLEARPEVQGSVIAMRDAIVAGRAVFGDVLAPR